MKKEIIKKAKNINNLSYSGDITLKVEEDGIVYKEATYHNTGRDKLFNFLADCLSGNFNEAKSSRPCRIVLFELSSTETDADGLSQAGLTQATYDIEPNKFISDPVKAATNWNDYTCVSTKVYYDNTPEITSSSGGSTVTYHFRIPYLCLVDGAKVRKLGLYPNEISSYTTDMCAYYILPKADEINIPTGGSNFTVIVDWKLQIKNK